MILIIRERKENGNKKKTLTVDSDGSLAKAFDMNGDGHLSEQELGNAPRVQKEKNSKMQMQ